MSTDLKQAYRISILVILLSAAIFALIAWQVFVAGNLDFDRTIALFAHQLHSKSFTTVMVWVTSLGSTNFLLPVYLVLTCLCLGTSSRLNTLLIAFTGAGTYALTATLKVFFGRTRPVDALIHPPITFSFPSGHSGSGMTLFLLLAFLVTRNRMKRGLKFAVFAFMFLLGLLVGFSRIYLNVHYPTDVLSGFCVAFFWLALMYLLYAQLSRAPFLTTKKTILNQRNV
jgi:undecaprenyl-diphosphatase